MLPHIHDARPEDQMTDCTIRPALDSDAGSINDIYNHYVRTSTATFDTTEKTLEERHAWLAEHGDDYPVVVAERDGVVIGWGSLSRWGTRCAYRHTVEISAYVAPDAVGCGLGSEISTSLIAAARRIGHHALVSQIVSENGPSLKMTARLGFEQVGVLHEVGRKFDRWLDLVFMEYLVPPVDEAAPAALAPEVSA